MSSYRQPFLQVAPFVCALFVGSLAVVGCGDGGNNHQNGDEVCDNGIDDDRDSLTDCADSDCASFAACQTPPECAVQADCLAKDNKKYSDYSSEPIPQCVQAKCVRPEANIKLNFSAKNGWNGLQGSINAVNTRFVKKTDVNGEPVTCARLAQDAPSHEPADADQIERTKKYNLQAYDVTSLGTSVPGGTQVTVPLMNMGTGADFIIWTEMWSQKKGSTTGLPQGKRIGWGCFETGPQVAEIKVTDADAPKRGISVTMPDPQNP